MQSHIARILAFRRSILLLVVVSALPASEASAIPIQLTSGVISQENRGPWPFEFTDTVVSLGAPGFLLNTDPRFDQLFLFIDVPGGTSVNLSHMMQILSVLSPMGPLPETQGSLIYGGQAYTGPGNLAITTPSVVVGPLVTVPFSLSGDVAGFELVGSGTATATFTFIGDYPGISPFWTLDDVTYAIEPPPIPEPTSLALLGSGLVGLASRRRSCRRES
jgi:hypothetical protein